MSEQEIRDQINKANNEVATWPNWKKGILTQSSQPTVSTPRLPVNNQSSIKINNKDT